MYSSRACKVLHNFAIPMLRYTLEPDSVAMLKIPQRLHTMAMCVEPGRGVD